MQSRSVYLIIIFVCAAGLNGWLLTTGNDRSGLVGIAFAIACLSIGYALPFPGKKGVSALMTSLPPRRPAQSVTLKRSERIAVAQIVNAFTIDLEDYFHTEVSSRDVDYEQWGKMPSRIESSTHRMLDLLDEHQVRATVFVLGWVAERYPRLVREVAVRGHEIACHSFRHKRVNQLTPRMFMEDTRSAKHAIEDATGERVDGYRAPSFSITPGTEWAFETLEQLGFTYDSSVHPVWHATYANARAPRFPYYPTKNNILEIPIATWRVGGVNLPVGGGAYLRLLPYTYIQHGLNSVNHREWQPVTLYVHPWEIDYLQPAIHSDFASHVRQLWGTRTMEARLHKLLSTMRFSSIADVYAKSFALEARPTSAPTEQIPFFAQVS